MYLSSTYELRNERKKLRHEDIDDDWFLACAALIASSELSHSGFSGTVNQIRSCITDQARIQPWRQFANLVISNKAGQTLGARDLRIACRTRPRNNWTARCHNGDFIEVRRFLELRCGRLQPLQMALCHVLSTQITNGLVCVTSYNRLQLKMIKIEAIQQLIGIIKHSTRGEFLTNSVSCFADHMSYLVDHNADFQDDIIRNT